MNCNAATGWGIALGVGFGTAIGVATGHIGAWLAIGTGVGLLIAYMIGRRDTNSADSNQVEKKG
jgi:hypothetical protein